MRTLLLILFLFTTFSFAQSPDDLMKRANQFYQEEKFSEAVDLYNKILNQGYESSALYYNLGNAYFKLDEIGLSILNYERALQLAPNDEDINYNLQIVKARTIDRIKEVPQIFIVEWWNTALSWLTVDGWSFITLLFYLMMLISVALIFFIRKAAMQRLSFYFAIIYLGFFLISSVILFVKVERESSLEYGILLEEVITVKVSPDLNSSDAFVIHEGLKFEVEDKLQNWVKIRLADGKVGWLPSNSFELI